MKPDPLWAMETDMKVSLVAIAALLASVAVQAQDVPPSPGHPPDAGHEAGPGRERGAERMQHLATLLDLTDAQKTQVEAVLREEHAKIRAQFEKAQSTNQTLAPGTLRALHEQIHSETVAKLTPILSATQLKKFEMIMQERGMRAGHMPKQDSPSDSPPPSPLLPKPQ